ncbi:hypothetical protein K493DRAFT_307515 [Basidiobolus meristosporus CBS 931.73]|uniref:Knr4/Smi1-like domain-containing protein n=1 Tax=Basidiobolus meristosporus CBS 931.73 TaxID=1314790 RepID=A0A1Y1XE15_9FUNG|nr:hypothetical protein K493DRAFT_307515 [Basidiobolus meristosporus CBS 931.73]|eukprot:ORX84000.1 hypothetical protein K493DRAFT_307515 [Basidiobolus meristosporus CBS 931.73]
MPALTLCRVKEDARELGQRLFEEDIYFQLPISEQKILEFEREHFVRLPEDYRALLSQVGNGTCPSSGLLPLGYVPYEYPVPYSDLLRNLCEPFPLTENFLFDAAGSLDENFLDSLNHGHIVLASDDYLNHWILIVEGPSRGEVWRRKSDVGFTRWASRAEFFSWLEARLITLKSSTEETSDEDSDMCMDTDEESEGEWDEDIKEDS